MIRKILPVVILVVAAAGSLHAQALTITTASPLPSGLSSPATPYSQTFTATGGVAPYTWTISGNGVPGLTFSSAGAFSGTPTNPGRYNFNVTVTDSKTPGPKNTATKAFTVGVFTMSPATLPNGTVGTPYSVSFTGSGGSGSRTWSIASGSLPTGLTLASNGALSGTPTSSGPFDFVIRITDSTTPIPLTVTRNYGLNIQNQTAPLTITTDSPLPSGLSSPATPYSQTLTATGGVAPYTWSISPANAVPGLTLSSAGVLSGTPTTPGRYTFNVTVTDSKTPNPKNTTSTAFTMGVFTMSPATLSDGTLGTPYSVTFTGSGGSGSLTWSIASGSLPTGLSLASNGALSGTPTVTGPFNFAIRLTDSTTPTALTVTRNYGLNIQNQTGSPLTITTASLPSGLSSPATTYSQTLTATGGVTPYTWSISPANAVPGLTLSSAGVLSGTPTTPGLYTFTVTVTDSKTPAPANTTSKSFTVGVFTIAPTSLVEGTAGTVYTPASFIATGGDAPYNWSVPFGSLPTGLNLSASGTLSGTPTQAGFFNLAIRLADSTQPSPLSVTQNYSLAVKPTIFSAAVNNGAVGVPFAQTLNLSPSNAPVTLQVTSGNLPPGLNLGNDGTISGTPILAGTYDYSITMTITSGTTVLTGVRSFSQVIQTSLTIITSSPLPDAVQNAQYSKQFESSAPPGQQITWSVIGGTLPSGLNLNPSTGFVTGTPSVAGIFDFTVRATTGTPSQSADKQFRISVNAVFTIVNLATLPDAILASPYSVTFSATGGAAPYRWNLTTASLPPGLTLADGPGGPSTNVLSGVPSALGTFNFTLRVVDNSFPQLETTRAFTLVVTTNMTIGTESLPTGFQNQAYSVAMSALGGSSPYTWIVSSGTLPTGITLSPSGILSGTPTEIGTHPLKLTVTDSRGKVLSQDYVLVIDPPVPTFNTGVPTSINPAATSNVGLTLSAPSPSQLKGQLVLTFTSRAEVPADDPMTKFSNGTRAVNFTIPANSATAEFSPAVTLSAGTVAGMVNFLVNIDNGPKNVASGTAEISAGPPQITNVVALRSPGGLEVQVTGYAPPRRITNVEFSFEIKLGEKTVTQSVQRSVDAEFGAWYRSPSATAFGSSFSYSQTFTVEGDTSTIQAVTVRLSNAQGGTSSASTPFK